MAKFCGNCGTQLKDDAKVCSKCGMPVDSVSASVSDMKKVKRIIKRVAGLVVFIVVAGSAFNVVSRFTGYNGLLRKVMTAYENYDIESLISLSSDMYYYGEEDGVEYYFENTVGDNLDSFESSVGHSYKLSYEVNETYVMSERRVDEMLSKIENTYSDFDVSVFEKIVVADLTLTAKQGSKSVHKDMNVIMSKEKGSWRLLYIE